jgi:predicted transcriptional regulator
MRIVVGGLCLAGIVSVRDIMTVNVKTAHTDSKVIEVVRKMTKFDVGSIVVVDSAKKPVGIVTSMDLVRSEPRLIAELGDLICPYYPAKKGKK